MRSWSEERVRWELASTFTIASAEIIFRIKLKRSRLLVSQRYCAHPAIIILFKAVFTTKGVINEETGKTVLCYDCRSQYTTAEVRFILKGQALSFHLPDSLGSPGLLLFLLRGQEQKREPKTLEAK